MRLLVHELDGDLNQRITIGSRNIRAFKIAPHLYLAQNQAGTLKVQIKNDAKVVIKESNDISIADIYTFFGGVQFIHAYVRFDIDFEFRKEQDYYISLSSTGYTFDEDNIVGWVNDYDLQKVDRGYTASSGFDTALDFELWEKIERK